MRDLNLAEDPTITMAANTLYTDLSDYYDLMCADIDYAAQSYCMHRLQKIFGNGGKKHLDLGCGTGPHLRHFIDYGYQSAGLDLNQPMLDKAAIRCPEAQFSLQNMSIFIVDETLDLITCFLYSIHYNDGIKSLEQCIASVHKALKVGGIFCFNVVDKNKIDNALFVEHTIKDRDGVFVFKSAWNYCGQGEKQSLKLSIKKATFGETHVWQDEHSMVAFSIAELKTMLEPYFEIPIFEHDYEKIIPWNEASGNAIFTCIKR